MPRTRTEAAIELSLVKGYALTKLDDWRAFLLVAATFYLLNDRKGMRHLIPIADAIDIEIEDEMIQHFESRNLIDAILEILSEEDRELLLERFESGKTIAEIAGTKGVTAESLRARSSRALRALRKNRKIVYEFVTIHPR